MTSKSAGTLSRTVLFWCVLRDNLKVVLKAPFKLPLALRPETQLRLLTAPARALVRKHKNTQQEVAALQRSLHPLPLYGEFSSLVLAPRGKACERACERGWGGRSYRNLKIGSLIKEALIKKALVKEGLATPSSAIGATVHEALSTGAQTTGDLATKASAEGTSATSLSADLTTALEALEALDNKKTHGLAGEQNGAVLHSDRTDLSDLTDLNSASAAPLPPGAEYLSAAAAQNLTGGSLTDNSLTEPVLTTPVSLTSLVVSRSWPHSPFLTCRKAGSPGAFCSPFTNIPSLGEAADSYAASSLITNHMKSLERQLCPVRPSHRAEAAVFGRRSNRMQRRKEFTAMHRSLMSGQFQDRLGASAARLANDEAVD